MLFKCSVPTRSHANTAPPQPPSQNPLVKSAHPALVNKSAGGLLTVASAGCTLGALLIGLIRNALPAVDISQFWQLAISGAIILIAII